jgi:hypothetical protein
LEIVGDAMKFKAGLSAAFSPAFLEWIFIRDDLERFELTLPGASPQEKKRRNLGRCCSKMDRI